LNQIVCDNKVSEMKALESLSVDEYYMTLNTYIRIAEERNEKAEAMGSGDGMSGNNNRKVTSLRK
jgi:hypothetical protein